MPFEPPHTHDARNMHRLDKVAAVNPESLGPSTPPAFQFRYIDIASVSRGAIDWDSVPTLAFSHSPSRARRVLRPGDVLLSTVRPGLQSHAYASWSEAEGYVASTGFAILRSSERMVPRFLYHTVFSNFIASQLHRLETGSNYPAVNERDVSSVRIPVPPLPEQRRIAEILDTVDDVIQQTEALIAKLKLMKAGLLHDLLTRGIDENGELRDPEAHPEQFQDSPLGRIPRGWDAVALESIVDLQVGYAFKSDWFNETEGIRLLRGENVGTGHPDWSETRYLPTALIRQFSEYELREHDVVIGMDRSFTSQGFKLSVLAKEDIPSLLVQRVGRFIPLSCSNPFLRAVLNSELYLSELMAQQKGMDIPHLSRSEILAPIVPVPIAEEQARIAAVFETMLIRISLEEAYSTKLKSLMSGLMDDLLTGRVRVNVPEEVTA